MADGERLLIVAEDHTQRLTKALLCSQLLALGIDTLYVEVEFSRERAALLARGEDPGPAALVESVAATSQLDLVAAALGMGVRVIGVDDGRLVARAQLLIESGDPAATPLVHGLLTARTRRMTERIALDLRTGDGAQRRLGRSMLLVGGAHVMDVAGGEGWSGALGIGTVLRRRGLRARDVHVLGELAPPMPQLRQREVPRDEDAVITREVVGGAEAYVVHLPWCGAELGTARLIHEHLPVPTSDYLHNVLSAQHGIAAPTYHFALGYAATRRRAHLEAAAHHQRAVELGEAVQGLDAARGLFTAMQRREEPGSPGKAAVVDAYAAVAAAGVPGAARIASGYLRILGEVEHAARLGARADREELDRDALWERQPRRRERLERSWVRRWQSAAVVI